MSAESSPWGGAAAVVTAGALLAAGAGGDVPVAVLAGVIALGAAGVLARRSVAVGVAASIPGAVLVGIGAEPSVGGLAGATAVCIVLLGLGTADLDRRWAGAGRIAPPGWPLIAGWAAAVALAVPDTEQALPASAVFLVAGALVVVGALSGRFQVTLGAIGWWSPAGVLAWLSCSGGIGRHGAVVGALAGAGMLAVEPLAVLLNGGSVARRRDGWAIVRIVGAHAALALVAARFVARPYDAWSAAVLATVLLAAGVAVAVAAAPLVDRADRRGSLVMPTGVVAILLVLAIAAPAAAQKGIVYRVVDGRELTLEVDAPSVDADARRPAVILVHGGGWRRGDVTDVALLADLVVAQGWVAVSPDYRLDVVPGYPAEPDDVAGAVAFMRQHAGEYGVDPDRIALLGSSAGGNLALEVALRAPGPLTSGERVVAAAALSGPTDLAALAEDASHQRAADAVREYLGCEPSACPALYAEASPVDDVDGGDPAVFLANSEDELIPSTQVAALAAPLRAAGVDATTMVVPGDRHGRGLTDQVWPDLAVFLQQAFGEPIVRPPNPNTDDIYAQATGDGEAQGEDQPPATGGTRDGTSEAAGDATGTGTDAKPGDPAGDGGSTSRDRASDDRADAALAAAVVAAVAAAVALGAAAVTIRSARRSATKGSAIGHDGQPGPAGTEHERS